MTATYPASIRLFTTRINLVDDVDASDVNDLQDEVTSLENTIGVAPTTDAHLNNRSTTWPTFKNRVEETQRNLHVPVCRVQNSGQACATNRSSYINFTAAAFDPFNMWPGSGAYVVPFKSAIWRVTANVKFLDIGSVGYYAAYIDNNAGASLSGHGPISFWGNGYQNWAPLSWEGELAINESWAVRVNHTAGGNVTVLVDASMTWVRDITSNVV